MVYEITSADCMVLLTAGFGQLKDKTRQYIEECVVAAPDDKTKVRVSLNADEYRAAVVLLGKEALCRT